MKPAQPGLLIKHRSDDGDYPFVPYDGCFEYSGRLPLGGLPCVPESLCPWCFWPAMSTCHDQHTPCTAGGGRGIVRPLHVDLSCRKFFCLASTNIFSAVSKILYIYIYRLHIYFWKNKSSPYFLLEYILKGAGSSYRG